MDVQKFTANIFHIQVSCFSFKTDTNFNERVSQTDKKSRKITANRESTAIFPGDLAIPLALLQATVNV